MDSAEGFERMLQIVNNYSGKKILIVVSACGKSTKILSQAAKIAETGDYDKAVETAEECIRLYTSILAGFGIMFPTLGESGFPKLIDGLKCLLKGISITGELTPRTLDAVISCGENFALGIASSVLQYRQINNIRIESSKLVKTDSNFGHATPDLNLSGKLINEILPDLFDRTDVVVTQGFVASDKKGETTTMGLESSNLSAALFAAVLNAGELVIYTDVEGIHDRDPKYSSEAKLFPHLSYSQAKFAGQSGLKLVFPAMIDILQEAKMHCRIVSAFNPTGDSTTIGEEEVGGPEALITLEDNKLDAEELRYGKSISDIPTTTETTSTSIAACGVKPYCFKRLIALNAESLASLTEKFSAEVSSAGRNLIYANFCKRTATLVQCRNISGELE